MRHVVDAVQVALTFLVIQELTFGFHDLDGVVAEEYLTGRPVARIFPVMSFILLRI